MTSDKSCSRATDDDVETTPRGQLREAEYDGGMLICENCGASTNERRGTDRLRLLPYPRYQMEFWCPKCHFRHGGLPILRRWLPVSNE